MTWPGIEPKSPRPLANTHTHTHSHIYRYACVHAYINVYMYARVHKCMYEFVYTYKYAHMYACMSTCIYKYIYVYLHMYMCVCVCVCVLWKISWFTYKKMLILMQKLALETLLFIYVFFEFIYQIPFTHSFKKFFEISQTTIFDFPYKIYSKLLTLFLFEWESNILFLQDAFNFNITKLS